MKIVFFGTPDFVIPILSKLCETYNTPRGKSLPAVRQGVIGVVTQPPKPAGREKMLQYSAVDNWAFKKKLNLITDINLVPDADLGVCAAYGAIIPQRVIDQFRLGILNVHPSLLPKYRGASPIQAAMVAGEDETGVTILKMDSELDHGPIVSSFKEKIGDDDTNEMLRGRLFVRASEFLIGLIPGYVENKVKIQDQDHTKASFCRALEKVDAFLDPKYLAAAMEGESLDEEWKIEFMNEYTQKPTAENIERFIRAMDLWPGAWTQLHLNGSAGQAPPKRLKILSAHVEEGKLVLEQVQLEGKGPVRWKQFLEGYPSAKFS